MTSNRKKQVALFVCHDLLGLLLVNRLVPLLLEAGLEPIIYNTGNKRNRQARVPAPPEPAFFLAEIVDKVLIPFLDTHSIRGSGIENYSLHNLTKLYGVPCQTIYDVNADALCKEVDNNPFLIGAISLRFLQIFEEKIIHTIENKGFFWNLHGGVLPTYKGLLIPYRVLENGETHYGWTLHRMAKSIDSGEVIKISTIELAHYPQTSILDLYLKMIPHGITMISDSVNRFVFHGQCEMTPQGYLSTSRYYSYPTAEEMKKYEQLGHSFIESPMMYIDYLVSQFCGPDAQVAEALRQTLTQAIGEWQQRFTGKHSPPSAAYHLAA